MKKSLILLASLLALNVSFAEGNKERPALTKEKAMAKASEHFDKSDVNKDGSLDKDEMKNARQKRHEHMKEKHAERKERREERKEERK